MMTIAMMIISIVLFRDNLVYKRQKCIEKNESKTVKLKTKIFMSVGFM